jgi:hypothetical protein
VNLFLANEFREFLLEKSNLFHAQHADKYKNSSESLAGKDDSITDMKTFLTIIILMGHVKKDKTRDYWSTSKLIENQIFGKLMRRTDLSKFEIFGITVIIAPWIMKQIDYTKSGHF